MEAPPITLNSLLDSAKGYFLDILYEVKFISINESIFNWYTNLTVSFLPGVLATLLWPPCGVPRFPNSILSFSSLKASQCVVEKLSYSWVWFTRLKEHGYTNFHLDKCIPITQWIPSLRKVYKSNLIELYKEGIVDSACISSSRKSSNSECI